MNKTIYCLLGRKDYFLAGILIFNMFEFSCLLSFEMSIAFVQELMFHPGLNWDERYGE